MMMSVLVQSVQYELVPMTPGLPRVTDRVQVFHYRDQAQRFVERMLLENGALIAEHHEYLQLPPNTSNAMAVDELVQRIMDKELVVRVRALGSGHRAGQPPAGKPKSQATAKPKPRLVPPDDDTKVVLQPSKKPDTPPEQYQMVVEVAGSRVDNCQGIAIRRPGEKSKRGLAYSDTRNPHRNLCRFNNLPDSSPVELFLTLNMKGRSQPLMLPLNEAATPELQGTERDLYQNVLVPVVPFQFATEREHKQEAKVLPPSWLYVFWKGKLWRELEIDPRMGMRDVDISLGVSDGPRPAEGNGVTAVWVPHKIAGATQTDVTFVCKPTQLGPSAVANLENNPAALRAAGTTLRGLDSYDSEKAFGEQQPDVGAVENAHIMEKAGQRLVQGHQKMQVAAAYLPPVFSQMSMTLTDQEGEPWSDVDVELELNGHKQTLRTDSSGLFTAKVPMGTSAGDIQLSIPEAAQPKQTLVSELDALKGVETPAGLQARLNNLGFDAGAVDGVIGPQTRAATHAFQKQHNLMVDGISGPQTQGALIQQHGA